MRNLYQVLGVRTTASAAEIKKRYRVLARENHPDIHAQKPEQERERRARAFREIQEAYDTLSESKRRDVYDDARRQWAKDKGAILCSGCGSANALTRRPLSDEEVRCSHCKDLLPIDLPSAVELQRARLIAEAAQVFEAIGTEVIEATGQVLRASISRLRVRFTKGTLSNAKK